MWYGTLTKKGGGGVYLRWKTIRIDPDFFCLSRKKDELYAFGMHGNEMVT